MLFTKMIETGYLYGIVNQTLSKDLLNKVIYG